MNWTFGSVLGVVAVISFAVFMVNEFERVGGGPVVSTIVFFGSLYLGVKALEKLEDWWNTPEEEEEA